MHAVLTGDIVDFTKMEQEGRERILQVLKRSFRQLDQRVFPSTESAFDVFRGDSFQGIVSKPDEALIAILYIRSLLRAVQQDSSTTWDVRVAAGIGSVDMLGDRPSEGDGEAFRLSGLALDAMNLRQRMVIQTPWDQINREFDASMALADAVIAKWSPNQAEMAVHLLLGRSRKEIAEELDISQAAVSYRVKGAGWFAMEKLLARYRELVQEKLKS